ncbi:hypothetical protein HYU92_06520 [Candidatus Curtissbacteria bacterium]|nr:hypothetical protein [Candidatus Curtissbacteria bacterium]
MDPQQEVPKRSGLWFGESLKEHQDVRLLDKTALVVCPTLALFAFMLFWPIISQINFEEVFFTPLVPFLMAALSLLGILKNEAMRILFIVSLMISTVGVYLLVRDLTKRHLTAILAALIYMLPPVPVFVLTYARQGLYQVELEAARNFLTIVYGDGGQFLGLALIPFAMIFLLRYLKSAAKIDLLLTVLLCSLIFLASRSQAFNLLLILAIVSLTEFFLGMARVKIRRFLLVVVLSLGLVAFWYTPGFLIESLLLYKNQLALNIRFLFPLFFILGLIVMFFAFVFFAKRARRQPIFVALLLAVVYLAIILEWFLERQALVPHTHRLFANLNMFLAIVLALAAAGIFDKLRLLEKLGVARWSAFAKSLGAIVFAIVSFVILVFLALTFSPYVVLLLAGSGGVWTKISLQVLADRQDAQALAGENFKLIRLETNAWQMSLGVILSLVFLSYLLLLLIRDREVEE